MSVFAGIFLIAHGLAHLPVWLAPVPPDAGFEPARSWLLGDLGALPRVLAAVACATLVVAGFLVVSGAGAGAAVAIAGAGISLVLVTLTFNRWFVLAVAINVAIIAVALS